MPIEPIGTGVIPTLNPSEHTLYPSKKSQEISNASSELIKATIQEKHMSYRGLAKLTGMNVSVISHMCAGTQKRFNKKTIQKLESVLEISIPDISNDAEAIIKDMEEGQTI